MRPNALVIKILILSLIPAVSISGYADRLADLSTKSSDKSSFTIHNLSVGNSSSEAGGRNSFLHCYGPWMIVAAVGTPLFAVDKDIMKFSQRRSLHSKLANNFFRPVHTIGEGWEYGIVIPLVVHGLIYKKNRSMVIAGELAAGLAAEGIVAQTFKMSFGRLRPYQSSSPYKFFKGGFSFFSGDVSTAFTFSTIMAKNYPRQNLGFIGIHHNVPLIPIFGYAAGGMVCLQRLYSNAHWSSDDYFGALAGYTVGSIVYHYGKKLHLKGFSLTSGRSRVLAACFSFN